VADGIAAPAAGVRGEMELGSREQAAGRRGRPSGRHLLTLVLLLGCFVGTRRAGAQTRPSPTPLAELERAWLALRTLHDQLGITRNLGATVSPRGVPADSLSARIARASSRVHGLAARVRAAELGRGDAAAFAQLREDLARLDSEAAARPAPLEDPPDCGDPLPEPLRSASLDSLTTRTFACYGAAARRIVVDHDTLDRLSILGLLGRTDDSARRRRLFLALAPVWRSVNGDDSAGSPYRTMVRLRKASWGSGESPMAERARGLGVSPDSLEQWLVAVLGAWRRTMPDSLLEPWDWYYLTGEASRLLSPRVARDSLRPLVNRYYHALGADPERLRVHYDLVPRPGKYPVSFTDFGARDPIEPWIFTSYRIGGLDNLGELLHEAGHAVHIAAIQTRGAYADWPDSDTFTEAIADLAALELYEADWQRKFLGDAAPRQSSLRAKYSGIVLDIAWSLFEIQAHRAPEQSPNEIWSAITRDYLRIKPHPEWSWWAMRGQLVGNPGYMLNYAFGAILIADLRAEVIARHGRFTTGDRSWYDWVSSRLYRFGRERPARDVVEQFLGRGVSAAALLQDLGRAGSPPN
jgi:hypothetical protein